MEVARKVQVGAHRHYLAPGVAGCGLIGFEQQRHRVGVGSADRQRLGRGAFECGSERGHAIATRLGPKARVMPGRIEGIDRGGICSGGKLALEVRLERSGAGRKVRGSGGDIAERYGRWKPLRLCLHSTEGSKRTNNSC